MHPSVMPQSDFFLFLSFPDRHQDFEYMDFMPTFLFLFLLQLRLKITWILLLSVRNI